MRKRALGLLILFLLISSSAHSSDGNDGNKKEWPANIAISFQIGANTISAIKNHRLKEQLISDAIAIGLAELTKRVVHKQRPDHSDNKSFYSEHTELAAVNQNWNYKFGIPVTFFIAEERVRTKKHDLVDVSVGAALGELIHQLNKRY